MILNLENSNTLITETGESLVVSDMKCNIYHVLSNMLGYRRMYLDGKGIRITDKNLLENFEPVENFGTMDFSTKDKEFKANYFVYKDKQLDYFICVDKDLSKSWGEDDDEKYIDGIYKVFELFYDVSDFEALLTINDKLNNITYVNNDSSNKAYLVLKTLKGFEFKDYEIKSLPVDIDTMYEDDFKEVNDVIVKELTDSNKGIVMLHGLAGTGKTNYIKHLTTIIPSKKFVYVPVSMIGSLADPSFISTLVDNKGSVLVLEDAESFIKDRSMNNESGVVSTLLNLSDGILSDVLGIQIICTFNSELGSIDEALLRKGRLIAEYKFDKLSVEKTAALLDLPVESVKPMTLTEIFNYDKNNNRVQKTQTKIGF